MNRIITFACAFAISTAAWAITPETAEARRCDATARAAAELVRADVEAACPCDDEWRNHGHYVQCVARTTGRLYRENGIARSCKRRAQKCAARSTCGRRETSTRCCITSGPECVGDITPGDEIAEGACGDSDVLCDTDADCERTRCRVVRDAETCEARGGVANGPGSCCEGCLPPEVEEPATAPAE